MFLRALTEEECVRANSFFVYYIPLRLVYEFISFLICLGISAWYLATNSIERHFILYSYWANAVCIVMFLSSFIHTYTFYYALKHKSEWINSQHIKVYLSVLKIFRDGLMYIIIMNLAVSAAAYWGFIGFSASTPLVTTLDHSLNLLLVIILYYCTPVYETIWFLVISLYYAADYYLFSIVIFYTSNYWIYWVEAFPISWGALCLGIFILQIAIYIILILVNYIKNRQFLGWNYEYYHIPHVSPSPVVMEFLPFVVLITQMFLVNVFILGASITLLNTSSVLYFHIVFSSVFLLWSIFTGYGAFKVAYYSTAYYEDFEHSFLVLSIMYGVSFFLDIGSTWFGLIISINLIPFYVMVNIGFLTILPLFLYFIYRQRYAKDVFVEFVPIKL